jgi:G3E family GTPase
VVDAAHVSAHLDEAKPEGVENESVEQVAFADRILLNKTDLCAPAALDALEARLRAMNGVARIVRTRNAVVPLEEVLGVAAFDLGRTLDMDTEFLNADGEHQHDASVTSVGIRAEGALSLERCNAWLGALLRDRGTDIFRSKGVLCIAGSEERFVFQGVHMSLAMGSSSDGGARAWGADEPRTNRLVFIGRNLDRAALQASFEACRA